MDELKWSKLMEVFGRDAAELVESFLNANGIKTALFQESVEVIRHPITFSRVQVFVPKELLEEARRLYDETGWDFNIAEEEDLENKE